jgi:4-hydroxybenzoate polyprenyltransferase
LIGVLYVAPVLPGGKRLRDLGWIKILLVGFSWGWLTAFYPWFILAEQPGLLSMLHGIDRMCFIVLLTIPFEIRDLKVDQQLQLSTLPSLLGRKRTSWLLIFLMLILFMAAGFHATHYFNPAYVATMMIISGVVLLSLKSAYHMEDDLFFSGFLDGLMIAAPWIYLGAGKFFD